VSLKFFNNKKISITVRKLKDDLSKEYIKRQSMIELYNFSHNTMKVTLKTSHQAKSKSNSKPEISH